MKKVIFTISYTWLIFLGHAQVTLTFQPDGTLGKEAINMDASVSLNALPTSIEGGHSTITESNESNRLFEKTIFVEVSVIEDSVVFKPLSKAWGLHWRISSDLTYNGSALMNTDKYKLSFNGRTENLWTVLHPMIIDGTLNSYYPYDPALYGLGTWDGYELNYPVVGEDERGSFLTSESPRENLCFLLGRLGPQSDIPMVNEYGEDSTAVLEDGSEVFLYPAPDFHWHTDKDIVKYKLRVSVLLKKNGKEKKRVIKSIAPIINRLSETGEIEGEQPVVWLDFEELEPILKKAYYFDEDLKSESYLNYFLQKVKNAPVKTKG